VSLSISDEKSLMVYNNKYIYIYLLLYTMPLKTPFELETVNDLNDHDLNDH